MPNLTHGGARKGAGRPPKPPGERKSHRLQVFVTDDAWRFVTRAALEGELTPSEYVADLICSTMMRAEGWSEEQVIEELTRPYPATDRPEQGSPAASPSPGTASPPRPA